MIDKTEGHIIINPDVEIFRKRWDYDNKQLRTIEIPKNSHLKMIDSEAFSNSSIESIILPASIKLIDFCSFSYCKNLKTVVISENAENVTLKNDIFYESSVESITFPSGFVIFHDNWCYRVMKLTRIIIPETNKQLIYQNNELLLGKSDINSDIYDIVLFANKEIKKAIIPSFIKRIDPSSFYSCKQLTTVDLSKCNQITEINPRSFYDTSIESIYIPSNVKKIGYNAFSTCKKLKSVTFPKNSQLKIIGHNAFYSTNIDNLIIPDSVELIEECAFAFCENLFTVEISPNSQLKEVKYHAFAHTNLYKISIPKNTKKIGVGCFYKSSLNKIEMPKNSELESIENYAFYSTFIDYFYIPASVKKIGSYAFDHCRTLEISKDSEYIKFENRSIISIENLLIFSQKIEFDNEWNGSILTLNNIELSKSITQYKYIDGKYLAGKSDPNSDVYDTLLYVARNSYVATIPSYIKIISNYAFSNCIILRQIMFEENSKLTVINNTAFKCESLTTITIPKHVKKIPEFVFYKHGNLKCVNFDENSELESIEESAFQFTGIEYIKIPKNVKIIANYAFNNCVFFKKI